jgi:hypothetical protein
VTVADRRATARLGLVESYRTSGRSDWIDATGRSMHPSIPAGSRLLVDFGRLPDRFGDVIVFRRGEQLIAHRLVGHRRTPDGGQWLARGDAEAFFDPPLDPDDVLGIVRAIARPDGRTEDLDAGRRRAGLLAAVSWWSGRGAGVGARALRRGTTAAHLRRAVLASLVALSRVPTRVVSVALPRPVRGREGGRR